MAQRAFWGRSPDVRPRFRPVTSTRRRQRPLQGTSADVTLPETGKRGPAQGKEKAGRGDRTGEKTEPGKERPGKDSKRKPARRSALAGKYPKDGAAAAGEGGVEGAAGVHPLLDGGEFGVK